MIPVQELSRKEITVATHSDADGLYSAALLSLAIPVKIIKYPEEFGEVDKEDICLDMIPLSPKYKGIVVDHHPLHPSIHSYQLEWEPVPTGLIIFHQLGHCIPTSKWWLVVGSCIGDGQPELIPPEIFKASPDLLEETISIYEKGGDYYTYKSPVWFQLSSYVNDACRIGRPEIAFEAIRNARSPLDILRNEALQLAREKVRKELVEVQKVYKPLDLGHIILWEIESDYGINSFLASKLETSIHKTVLVYNKKSGKFSIRGVLAEAVRKQLVTEKGIRVGGHAGFSGGTVLDSSKYKRLLEVVRSL